MQAATPLSGRPGRPDRLDPGDVAPRGSAPRGGSAQEEVICFQIHGQELAVPITAVKETMRAPPLCRLPLCPDFLAGLMNLRGDVVAVLDLGRLIDIAPSAPRSGERDPRRIILLRGALRGGSGHGALCGLLVERLTAARRLRAEEIRPVPPGLKDATAACLRGVASLEAEGRAQRPLLLLDLQRLLQSERLLPFRRSARIEGGV